MNDAVPVLSGDRPGALRVTALFEDGSGGTAFLDYAALPLAFERMDRLPVAGTDYRGHLADPVAWIAERQRTMTLVTEPGSAGLALLALAYLAHRHPREPGVADAVAGLMAEHGSACILFVADRRKGRGGVGGLTVTATFDPATAEMAFAESRKAKAGGFRRLRLGEWTEDA